MVQMKGLRHVIRNSETVLYIPHGSDESKFAKRTQEKLYNFISHMVQMKVFRRWYRAHLRKFFISHMVQMKERDCYCFSFFRSGLYIPHGSDESYSSA